MSGTGRLDLAILRLERATNLLEQRLSQGGDPGAGGLFDLDRARLAADLDACRARERELREAAQQAAEAVDKATAAVTAALSAAET